MSVEAFTWALSVPVGGNQKVALLGLANHAHPDGTEAYPALETIARYAHCDRSTAKRNVRKLEEVGWIQRDGHGPRGETKYKLAMGDPFPRGVHSAPGASAPRGEGTSAQEGGAPVPPEPSLGTDQNRQQTKEGARDPKQSLPVDFPEEMRPHAKAVYRVLNDVAAQHQLPAIVPLQLGRTMMRFRRRPLVATAHELHIWAADPPRPIRNVVQTYATFLGKTRDLAALERLADDGLPTTGPSAHPPGVTPIRRGSNADRVQENLDALDELERRYGG